MRRSRGQSLVEVAVVLALIAIAAITVYGDEVRKVFGISDGSLAGETDLEHEPKPDGVSEKHNLWQLRDAELARLRERRLQLPLT